MICYPDILRNDYHSNTSVGSRGHFLWTFTCAPSNLSEPEAVPVTIIATRLHVAPPGTLRLAAGSLLPLSHLAATLGSRPSTASAGSFVQMPHGAPSGLFRFLWRPPPGPARCVNGSISFSLFFLWPITFHCAYTASLNRPSTDSHLGCSAVNNSPTDTGCRHSVTPRLRFRWMDTQSGIAGVHSRSLYV